MEWGPPHVLHSKSLASINWSGMFNIRRSYKWRGIHLSCCNIFVQDQFDSTLVKLPNNISWQIYQIFFWMFLKVNSQNCSCCSNSTGHEQVKFQKVGRWCSFLQIPKIVSEAQIVRQGPKFSEVISHGWAGGQANLWFTECTNFPPTWAREEVALFRM